MFDSPQARWIQFNRWCIDNVYRKTTSQKNNVQIRRYIWNVHENQWDCARTATKKHKQNYWQFSRVIDDHSDDSKTKSVKCFENKCVLVSAELQFCDAQVVKLGFVMQLFRVAGSGCVENLTNCDRRIWIDFCVICHAVENLGEEHVKTEK